MVVVLVLLGVLTIGGLMLPYEIRLAKSGFRHYVKAPFLVWLEEVRKALSS